MRFSSIQPLAVLIVVAAPFGALADKNPDGNCTFSGGHFVCNGQIAHPTQGSGAPVGSAVLPAPPAGWRLTQGLPTAPSVRHDLTLSNWSITDIASGQVVGTWEWDTGKQNFFGHYVNGVNDVLRFEEWNRPENGGRIVVAGFNSAGLPVRFEGVLTPNGASGTAIAGPKEHPVLTWKWRASF